MKGSVVGSPSAFSADFEALHGNCWNTEATEATETTERSTATARPTSTAGTRMTRKQRMKGQRQHQRQRLSLWVWRERLCAEKPIKAVAVDDAVLPFPSFFLFLPPWLLESQSPSGMQPRTPTPTLEAVLHDLRSLHVLPVAAPGKPVAQRSPDRPHHPDQPPT